MRVRLNNPMSDAEYQVVRDNNTWSDHVLRYQTTGAALAWLDQDTVCDPACGDASIVLTAHKIRPLRMAFLSDISRPNIDALRLPDDLESVVTVGDVFDTLIPADVLVLTEILEHIEKPEDLLVKAKPLYKYLIASSPVGETSISNHEHVWGWDGDGYRQMLVEAGWLPIASQELRFYPKQYDFQLWVCR